MWKQRLRGYTPCESETWSLRNIRKVKFFWVQWHVKPAQAGKIPASWQEEFHFYRKMPRLHLPLFSGFCFSTSMPF